MIEKQEERERFMDFIAITIIMPRFEFAWYLMEYIDMEKNNKISFLLTSVIFLGYF